MTATPSEIRTSITMPLEHAYLCVDCSAVGNSSAWCHACSSVNVLSLAKVLNRETERPVARSQMGDGE